MDGVGVLFSSSTIPEGRLELPPRGSMIFRLSSPQDRKQASLETKEALKLAPNHDRLAFLVKLPDLLGIRCPPPIPEEHAPLTWDEVRLMTKAGVEFGAHTKSHPILSRLGSLDEVREELSGSKRRIEHETGLPVRHFCYPNGHLRDYTPDTVRIVRECSFLTWSDIYLSTASINCRAGVYSHAMRRFPNATAGTGLLTMTHPFAAKWASA